MPRPTPPFKIDPGIASAYRELEAARLAQAIVNRNKQSIEAIRFRWNGGQGMSKARLEQIYGKQLVYIALQQEDEK